MSCGCDERREKIQRNLNSIVVFSKSTYLALKEMLSRDPSKRQWISKTVLQQIEQTE